MVLWADFRFHANSNCRPISAFGRRRRFLTFLVCALWRFVQQGAIWKHIGSDGSRLNDRQNHKPCTDKSLFTTSRFPKLLYVFGSGFVVSHSFLLGIKSKVNPEAISKTLSLRRTYSAL